MKKMTNQLLSLLSTSILFIMCGVIDPCFAADYKENSYHTHGSSDELHLNESKENELMHPTSTETSFFSNLDTELDTIHQAMNTSHTISKQAVNETFDYFVNDSTQKTSTAFLIQYLELIKRNQKRHNELTMSILKESTIDDKEKIRRLQEASNLSSILLNKLCNDIQSNEEKGRENQHLCIQDARTKVISLLEISHKKSVKSFDLCQKSIHNKIHFSQKQIQQRETHWHQKLNTKHSHPQLPLKIPPCLDIKPSLRFIHLNLIQHLLYRFLKENIENIHYVSLQKKKTQQNTSLKIMNTILDNMIYNQNIYHTLDPTSKTDNFASIIKNSLTVNTLAQENINIHTNQIIQLQKNSQETQEIIHNDFINKLNTILTIYLKMSKSSLNIFEQGCNSLFELKGIAENQNITYGQKIVHIISQHNKEVLEYTRNMNKVKLDFFKKKSSMQ